MICKISEQTSEAASKFFRNHENFSPEAGKNEPCHGRMLLSWPHSAISGPYVVVVYWPYRGRILWPYSCHVAIVNLSISRYCFSAI